MRCPRQRDPWRGSSYEWVQQPLYYLGAAGVLEATGLDAPPPALVENPRSRIRPGGTEPTLFQHGAPPSPRQVTARSRVAPALVVHGRGHRLGHRAPGAHADRRWLVIATVAGGLALMPAVDAVMGAVSTDPPATLLCCPGDARHHPRCTRTDDRVMAAGDGSPDWRRLRGEGHCRVPGANGGDCVRARCRQSRACGPPSQVGVADAGRRPAARAPVRSRHRHDRRMGTRASVARVRRSASVCLQEGHPRGGRLRAAAGPDAVDARVLGADARDGVRAVLGAVRVAGRRTVPGQPGVGPLRARVHRAPALAPGVGSRGARAWTPNAPWVSWTGWRSTSRGYVPGVPPARPLHSWCAAWASRSAWPRGSPSTLRRAPTWSSTGRRDTSCRSRRRRRCSWRLAWNASGMQRRWCHARSRLESAWYSSPSPSPASACSRRRC